MKNWRRQCLLNVLTLGVLFPLVAPACAQSAQPLASTPESALAEGYQLFRSFVLPGQALQQGGVLRLSQDARITTSLREEHWQIDGGASWATEMVPALRPSRLEWIGSRGQVLAAQDVTVLAELERMRPAPAPGRSLYLLTVDESQGAGSGNGQVTSILEPLSQGLRPMEVEDAKGKVQPLRLVTNLRSAWRIWRTGRGYEIFQVSSPLGGADGKSRIVFTRYRLQAHRWLAKQKIRDGLWLNEFEDAFPKRSRFP